MTSPALDENLSVVSASTSSLYLDAAVSSDRLSPHSDSAHSKERTASLPVPSLSADRAERLVASWLESLLQRYSIQQLNVISEQGLSTLLTCCQSSDSIERELSELHGSSLIAELKRRIRRLSGAQLGEAFVSMSPAIVDEAETEPLFLTVEGRQLQGLRYQGEVYRLMDSFVPSYRLQAYCLGQTLNERTISYVITRSPKRFAVWVNAKALPQRSLPV